MFGFASFATSESIFHHTLYAYSLSHAIRVTEGPRQFCRRHPCISEPAAAALFKRKKSVHRLTFVPEELRFICTTYAKYTPRPNLYVGSSGP
jgi:hypothetical protein